MYNKDELISQLNLRKECVKKYDYEFLNYDIDRLIIESLCFSIPQSWGLKFQNWFADRLMFNIVSQKENKGDLVTVNKAKEYYEFKSSMVNDFKNSNYFNIKNVRIWQDVKYYLCFFIDAKDLNNIKKYVFQLTKAQMIEELKLMKAIPSNGTKFANINNIYMDLSFSINYKSANWERWVTKYEITNHLNFL